MTQFVGSTTRGGIVRMRVLEHKTIHFLNYRFKNTDNKRKGYV